MTDKEALLWLLDRFGILGGCVVRGDSVTLDAKAHAKIMGYIGFSATFEFDADGKFKEVGLYE